MTLFEKKNTKMPYSENVVNLSGQMNPLPVAPSGPLEEMREP